MILQALDFLNFHPIKNKNNILRSQKNMLNLQYL